MFKVINAESSQKTTYTLYNAPINIPLVVTYSNDREYLYLEIGDVVVVLQSCGDIRYILCQKYQYIHRPNYTIHLQEPDTSQQIIFNNKPIK
jgi:hypothetical protein